MIAWPYQDLAELMQHGNPVFGDWEGTVRGDDVEAFEVETPIGEECVLCEEAVQEGDTGEIAQYLDMERGKGMLRVVAQHRECMILTIMGHQVGVCVCTGFAGQPTRRLAAIEADRRVQQLRRRW